MTANIFMGKMDHKRIIKENNETFSIIFDEEIDANLVKIFMQDYIIDIALCVHMEWLLEALGMDPSSYIYPEYGWTTMNSVSVYKPQYCCLPAYGWTTIEGIRVYPCDTGEFELRMPKPVMFNEVNLW